MSIKPKDDFIPDAVDITLAFSGLSQLKQQPIVIDSFPETGFNPGAFQGSASVTLTSEAKFAPLPIETLGKVAAGAQINAGLAYKYAPAYANVVSGFGSAHAFWQFKRTQDKYPVGEIPIKLLIALPKSYTKRALSMDFDVRTRFSGAWWKTGLTVATFTSVVTLPDSK